MKKFLSQKDMATAKKDEAVQFALAKRRNKKIHGVDQTLSQPGDIVSFDRATIKGNFNFKKQQKCPTKRKAVTKVCVHFSGKAS